MEWLLWVLVGFNFALSLGAIWTVRGQARMIGLFMQHVEGSFKSIAELLALHRQALEHTRKLFVKVGIHPEDL